MEITAEEKGTLTQEIKIVLKPEDYNAKLRRRVREKQETLVLPGFRKGKIPFDFLKKHYIESLFYKEFYEFIHETLENYLKENNLRAIGYPIPSKDNFYLGETWTYNSDLEFIYEIGMTPVINLDQEFDAKINRYLVDVTDEMIDEDITDVIRQSSSYAKGEEIAAGDYIIGEFIELDANNEKKENGVNLKSGFLIDLLTDTDEKAKMIGLKQNEELIFDLKKAITNDTELSSLLNIKKEEVSNLTNNFKLIITSITRIEKPAIGQELFDRVFGEGKVSNEEEFRNGIKYSIESNYSNTSSAQLAYDIRAYLMGKLNIILPDEFIKRSYAINGEDKFSTEDINNHYPEIAENMKWGFIQDAFTEKFDVKVMQDEFYEVGIQYYKEAMMKEKIPMTEENNKKYMGMFFESEKNKKLIVEKVIEIKTIEAIAEFLKVEDMTLPIADFYDKMTFKKELERNN